MERACHHEPFGALGLCNTDDSALFRSIRGGAVGERVTNDLHSRILRVG
jgi:hypothetical protein